MDPMLWFRNVKATQAFSAGQVSLGYSLQLSAGIHNFHAAHPTAVIQARRAPGAGPQAQKIFPVTRGEDDE